MNETELKDNGYRVAPLKTELSDIKDWAIAVKTESAYLHRKIILLAPTATGDWEVARVHQILDTKTARKVAEEAYPEAASLLYLFRLMLKGLRRKNRHRDIIEQPLTEDALRGHVVSKTRGDTWESANERRTEMSEYNKALDVDSHDMDQLLWTSLTDAPWEQYDFREDNKQKFILSLCDYLGQVEDWCNEMGEDNAADRLLDTLEVLRKQGFSVLEIGTPQECRQYFKCMLRDALHMTSNWAGATVQAIIFGAGNIDYNDVERKIVNLMHGACYEFAGVALDLLGIRLRPYEQYIEELVDAIARDDKDKEEEMRERIAAVHILSAIYLPKLREAWTQVYREQRCKEHGALEVGLKVYEDSEEDPLHQFEANEIEHDYIEIFNQWMDNPELQSAIKDGLQKRTWEVLVALAECSWDATEAAKVLTHKQQKETTPENVRDVIRKTLNSRLPGIVQRFADENELPGFSLIGVN